MKTVPLGGSGTRVSAMALGAMTFGSDIPEADAVQVLDRYAAGGGSFIDTANIYADWVEGGRAGDSERCLGRWMRARSNRGAMFIATKLGGGYEDVKPGLRPEAIVAECEKSLRRLQTDYIDLYFAHHDDPETPLEASLEAFDRLVRAGKVRHLGASNYRAWRLAEALCVSRHNGWAAYACIQQLHTYLRVHPAAEMHNHPSADRQMLDLCLERNLALMAYSPILGGAYDGRTDKPFNRIFDGLDSRARLAALNEVAAKHEVKPSTIVLAWMMNSRPPVIPLFSASSPGQVEANLGALDIRLDAQDMERLNSARG